MVHKNARTVNDCFCPWDAAHIFAVRVYAGTIAGGLKAGRQGMRGILADDCGPFTDLPVRDQPAGHIGVGPGERFDRLFRGGREKQHGAIHRIGECTAQQKLSPRDGFTGVFHVCAAELRATLEDVGHVCI